jgi:tripartite-type tricarboxylate transporter receptor subunit TctC
MRRVARRLLVGLAALALAGAATAQDYPTRSINIIVPFAAGGPTDTVARLLGQSMSRTLGQTLVVENVGGAGGTLGAAKAAQSRPDGYVVFLHHIGHATSATLYRKLPYDTIADFEPIGQIADVPQTLVAKLDFPASDLRGLVAHVKAQGEKLSYGNAGIGSASHLCGMLLMTALGTEMTTVPYRGTGPAMNDLVAGQIDLMCDQTTNTTGQIKAGKIKAYAVTTRTRVPALPELPTADEAGLPGFEVFVWHGLYAPKGTPAPIIAKLAQALQAALKDDTVIRRFAELGAQAVPEDRVTPDSLRTRLKSEIERWAPIIKAAGVYAD